MGADVYIPKDLDRRELANGSNYPVVNGKFIQSKTRATTDAGRTGSSRT